MQFVTVIGTQRLFMDAAYRLVLASQNCSSTALNTMSKWHCFIWGDGEVYFEGTTSMGATACEKYGSRGKNNH